jgi:hypothetical protein
MNIGPTPSKTISWPCGWEGSGVESESAAGQLVPVEAVLAVRLVPMRHCERCTKLGFVWTMRFVRRPLGGRPYWICRSCRHSWRGKSTPSVRGFISR